MVGVFRLYSRKTAPDYTVGALWRLFVVLLSQKKVRQRFSNTELQENHGSCMYIHVHVMPLNKVHRTNILLGCVIETKKNLCLHSSSETQGQIVGPKTKIKTGRKKFDEQKYERKIRTPGDKLFTHQFQTAERILAPDWAANFSAQSAASIRSAVWNWCVKSLSPGARIFLSYFCLSKFFPPVLIFVFGPTICPWVSEDGLHLEMTKCFK